MEDAINLLRNVQLKKGENKGKRERYHIPFSLTIKEPELLEKYRTRLERSQSTAFCKLRSCRSKQGQER